jgi:putative phosphoribosyl transferase
LNNPTKRKRLVLPGAEKGQASARVTRKPVGIDLGERVLRAELAQPANPAGWLLIPKLGPEQKRARLNAATVRDLNALGLGTLTVNLPGRDQPLHVAADWLEEATRWFQTQPAARDLPLGYFGSGRATTPALMAAASIPEIAAVLSWNAKPIRAWRYLHSVHAPTLLMIGQDSPRGMWLSNWLAGC